MGASTLMDMIEVTAARLLLKVAQPQPCETPIQSKIPHPNVVLCMQIFFPKACILNYLGFYRMNVAFSCIILTKFLNEGFWSG